MQTWDPLDIVGTSVATDLNPFFSKFEALFINTMGMALLVTI